MASKTARQAAAAQRRKQIRSDLAKLKRKGLYSGDARKAKGNSYQARLVEKYSDVLRKEATVVKTGTKAARDFKASGARGVLDRIVVEAAPGEQVRYNKKTGTITGRRRVEDNTRTVYRNVYFQRVFNPRRLPRPPKGVEYRYRVAFKVTGRRTGFTPWFSNADLLSSYMNEYKSAKEGTQASRAEFEKLWTGQVNVQSVNRKIREVDEDELEDDEFYET